ncbi:sugar phosphate isomerase/epimerase family protein [Cohnella silvisoli]|uniref:Sugar phosphate isomerase/epimerase family protein n=1 Tax=Cohnella silvisoli TaxID=2873699 RepID=A0ABV1KRX1_9BACL|nr:sugar phosphate isomerase/epimerase family protein [Cohnella silvisoli]MCD9022495.1 sugar phosphate isomerase/epimerase [Cohnella silvisoli]
MTKQPFEVKNERIRSAFLELKKSSPEKLVQRLNLSWSNWGFGMESLEESAKRLNRAGIGYIELHGNHYGEDLGYKVDETLATLEKYQIKVAGVCGMFSVDNDLSSNRAVHRQAAIDYLKREIEFTAAVGGSYLLVVPGAVGRPKPYDDMEFQRSVETLRIVADLFVQYGVKAAIEPIRSAEVSLVRSIAEAKAYIHAVDHPGVQDINADVYHMQAEEAHIGEALLEAGDRLVNLHMADSNRYALGEGSMDLDTIIMALYLLGFNREGKYVTPEPLGPGGDPYPAMYGKPQTAKLDHLVMQSISYFRERENVLLAES